jgi:phage shock protein PspC (stress-responsive transcriptional regulator)
MLVTVNATSRRTARAEDTVRDLWVTRPRRARTGKKFAGVAAGIARRYQLDPILVRITFVIAACYGGAGLVAYLLGWLLLPTEDDEVSAFESLLSTGRSSTPLIFTVALCAALFPATALLLNTSVYGGIGVLLLGAALFLLHRNRGHLGRPNQERPGPSFGTNDSGGPASTPATSHGAVGVSYATDTGERATGTPPAWDPLGAAPFAWDLPEPTPQPEEPPAPERGRRSKVGVMTLGAALVVGAAGMLAAPYSSWFTAGHVVGTVLAVLGIGLVAGSFFRAGRGLIALVVPLSAIGMVFSISPSSSGFDGVGDIIEGPTVLDAVRPSYRRTAGTIDVDLSGLPTTGELRPTEVWVGTGTAVVRLPPTADVDLVCHAGAGSITCLGRHSDGTDARLQVTDFGDDGPGGLKITMKVHAGLGDIEVYRG